MGSVLSHATAETVVVVIVTAACTALAYTFVLRFAPASSGAQLADTESSQLGTKSKRKKRSARSQTSAGAAEDTETDPKSSRSGQPQVVSKMEPSGRDPVTIQPAKVIPGDFEGRIETSTSTGDAAAHSSQEPGVATAKRGKKKKNKKVNLDGLGSGAPVEDRSVQGVSREQLTSWESNGRSSSAVSTAKSEETKPSHQQQPRLLNPDTSLKRESRLQSSPSLDTDGSWTRVASHRLKESDGKADVSVVVSTDFTISDVGASTAGESLVAEITDEDIGDLTGGNVAETRRTLAEKLVPKPRRTGVEDMLQKPDVPTLARVMRVVSQTDEIPAQESAWENYEDGAVSHTTVNDADGEDEGGWDIVKGKNHSRNPGTTLSPQQTTPLSPQPSADRAMTKKQRQNAKKREMLKVAKAKAEAIRLEGLAKHKRGLERQRIIEMSRSGGGKRPSGGMQAVVDDRGKLVWE
ncbi:hypothetical protein EDD16DRAFT_1664371 [Pisolithus croceorrhizus]|nr:hypothetical protein EDD16DRAFT_1664371 [Pisolithus croceorrhizus]KAI6167379.1 hypothetical protein EDD17DRAFT_1540498 [Pisolithus thermaeus]